jgi:membrane fusion protein (multidrug efflux system)
MNMLSVEKIVILRNIKGGIILLVGVGSLLTSAMGCSKPDAAGGMRMPPMPVETARAESRTIADRFEAVGTINADEAVTIVSEIDATVISLPFKEGQHIKAGQLIARLDDSQLAAELTRAEALRDKSKITYERTKTVVSQNAGTPQDLDNAAADLKVAEANLALARARFAKTRIVAPFDGIMGVRQVSVGKFLRPGQKIVEIANLDNIRVAFSIPEGYLTRLERGSEVTVFTPAHEDQKVKGKIFAIEPVVDPDTRSGQVIALVPNSDENFLPGMSANISVTLSERSNAITIPNEAVFASGDQSFVFVVKQDSSVTQVPIVLGTQRSDVVEVLKGLDAGALVVRAGHQKLYEGAKVLPVSGDKPVN